MARKHWSAQPQPDAMVGQDCQPARARRMWVFFFQAEDGIRDVAVTGVQTCALPISTAKAPPGNAKAGAKVFADKGCGGCHTFKPAGSTKTIGPDLDKLADYANKARSEERRVGKEWRSRWAPYH